MKKLLSTIALLLLVISFGCTPISERTIRRASEVDSKVIAHDGTFIAYASGVVYDKNTGLEWYAGPDKDTKWKQAKRWTERLQVAGGGWRLPTIKELKTLYEKDVGTRNMTPLLKTTGWLIWSGETKGSFRAWGFHFGPGYEFWLTRDISHNAQGFAVRSRR